MIRPPSGGVKSLVSDPPLGGLKIKTYYLGLITVKNLKNNIEKTIEIKKALWPA